MDIDLSIEHLILHGIDLPRGQRQLLRASVETELARLLADGGLPSQMTTGSVQSRLSGSEIHLQTGSAAPDPVQLGVQIAQAVYGGITR